MLRPNAMILAVLVAILPCRADENWTPQRIEITKLPDTEIAPGDRLDFTVKSGDKTVSRETLLIDAAHTAYFPDLGRISLHGVTPQQAADLVTKLYREKLSRQMTATIVYQAAFRNISPPEGR